MSALLRDLKARLRGEVLFDNASRAAYSTDASNYRQVPIGVVLPHDAEDIIQALEICRHHEAPIVPRGAGTSLAGQCCNIAVVLDTSKHMNRILELDPQRRVARVEPGVILDDLRDEAERHHLTFGPDPSTHRQCTLGGMIGNNACGVHSVMAGRTAENVEEMEIATYDGVRLHVGKTPEAAVQKLEAEGGRKGGIYRQLRELRDCHQDEIRQRYPKIPRCVSGYNLPALLPEQEFHVARALVGTEGTCAMILQALVRLVPSPPERTMLVVGFPDVYQAGDRVAEILTYGPIGLEGMDDQLVASLQKRPVRGTRPDLLPDGRGWLLIEFGERTRAERLIKALTGLPMKLVLDRQQQLGLWKIRESGLSATARVPGEKDKWEGWEDASVAPEKLGPYLRELRQLFDKHGYRGALYGHFGDGCVHTRNDFDLASREGIEKFRAFVLEGADLVLKYGGSLSGEHGDGQARAELLPKMFGPKLVEGFRQFKHIWDPQGKMNPGKKVDPYRLDENLRMGAGFTYARPRTHFSYGQDEGSFSRAVSRCVGVGACRRVSGGTMCPSYMVTRQEVHSTRGRAHLLYEMMHGAGLEGWQDETIKEALDLCLACKGCKGECPMQVDVATYKAEFLSHYYQTRIRPVSAFSMGLIPFWARAASWAPRVVNFFTQTPALRRLVQAAGGIAPERRIPEFALRTFRQGFRPKSQDGSKVLLWTDTLTNYFQPQIAQAAVRVLESAGFSIEIPPRGLCCARPLFDYGMLDLAKRMLQRLLVALTPWIEQGIPVIGLEPSCLAVFRDELTNLFPNDPRARKLSDQSFLLCEFLLRKNVPLPRLSGRAIVHGHCHQKSIMGLQSEETVLRTLGLDTEVLDSGCCGMAGAFGMEREHYKISIQCAERVLLPAVRRAPPEAILVSDGFSCREQIFQCTGRRPLHLSQVVERAVSQG